MKKVRIVFVNYQLICGGAEQALFDLINLLDKEKLKLLSLCSMRAATGRKNSAMPESW